MMSPPSWMKATTAMMNTFGKTRSHAFLTSLIWAAHDESCYSKVDSDIISVMGSSDEDLEMGFSGFSIPPLSTAPLNASDSSESAADVFGEVRSKHAPGTALTNPSLSTAKGRLLIVPDLDELVTSDLPYHPNSRQSHTGSLPALPTQPLALPGNAGLGHTVQPPQACPRTPSNKVMHNPPRAQSSIIKQSASNRQKARQLGGAVTPRRRSSSGSVAAFPYHQAGAHVCHACGTTSTPLWRGGPNGPKTLCNACGVRWMEVQAPPNDHRRNVYECTCGVQQCAYLWGYSWG